MTTLTAGIGSICGIGLILVDDMLSETPELKLWFIDKRRKAIMIQNFLFPDSG